MGSTFFGLELGKRALYAQRGALNTTGNNISNANTDGYTRQRAEMQSTREIPYPGMNNQVGAGQLGTGVEVNKIARLRNSFLDLQFRNQNHSAGYYEALSDTYIKIEELLNEPSDSGIAAAMDQFWQGWEELSKTPDSSSTRVVVAQRGVALAESFNFAFKQLEQISSELSDVIKIKTDTINSITKQISELNTQISNVVPHGYQPNELYDKRDVLIDQLSKLVNIEVKPVSSVDSYGNTIDTGVLNINIKNQSSTQPLVKGSTANVISYVDGSLDQISIQDPSTGLSNTMSIDSGELFGRIQASTKIVEDIKNDLKDLENEFFKSVNDIHAAGYSLVDINNSTKTPMDFFIFDTSNPDDQKWIVNKEIVDNPNKIAAAEKENVGDGNNALTMSKLKSGLILFPDGTKTNANDYYQQIIGRLGIQSQEAQRMQANTELLVYQVENNRQSISGVSLDEEMTNMIRFQQAYNAAARVVTVMDEVLDKIVNGMGATR